jgi:hypothetical protein
LGGNVINGLVKFGAQETKDKNGAVKWRPIICVTSRSRDIEFLADILIDTKEECTAFISVLERILSSRSKPTLVL